MLISRAFSLASILITTVSAATSTASCNPIKSSSCSPNPALGGSMQENFQNGLGSYFTNSGNQGDVKTGDEGLSLTVNKRFDNPSIHSDFYLMFGYVEVELKAGEGKGIVSSFFLQSDDLDEIDIELFGGDEYEWQSNYFVQGNTSTYDRGGYHSINPSPLTNYHKYAINWTKDSLDWIVDGSVIRSLHITNSQGYPQSPMRIYAGIWAAQAPFTMHIKSITAIDYSTGSEYSYSDQSGYWQSIDAKDGEVNGRYSDAQSDVNKAVNGDSIENSGSSDSPSTTQSSSESSSTTESSSESSSTTESSSESSSTTESSSESSSTTESSSESSSTTESSSESSSTTESSSESSSTTENSSSFSESTQESQSSSEPNSSASSAETTETSESTQTTRGGANKVETDASSFSSSVATTSAETDSSEQETTTSSSSSSDETHSVSSSSENSACRFTSPRSMQFVTVLVSFVSFGFVLV
ncbi:unnamed protein product [Candida parapsilosis]|nr:unnamed protein product [Candida parapsilosis]